MVAQLFPAAAKRGMYSSLPAAELFGDGRGGQSQVIAGGENDPVVSGKRMEKGVHRMRKLPCLNDLLHIVPPRDALGELVERRGRLTAAAFLRAVGAKAGKGGVSYGAEQIRAEVLRALRRDGVSE